MGLAGWAVGSHHGLALLSEKYLIFEKKISSESAKFGLCKI
jgi:hypothetical protein